MGYFFEDFEKHLKDHLESTECSIYSPDANTVKQVLNYGKRRWYEEIEILSKQVAYEEWPDTLKDFGEVFRRVTTEFLWLNWCKKNNFLPQDRHDPCRAQAHATHVRRYLLSAPSEPNELIKYDSEYDMYYIDDYKDEHRLESTHFPKLDIELVPGSCFKSTLRTIVDYNTWKKTSKMVREHKNHTCDFCNAKPTRPGGLHCHEVWSYNDKTNVQKLEKFSSICRMCHYVKHLGKANVDGTDDKALNQFIKINNTTKEKATKYINNQFSIWEARSLFSWDLDLSSMEKMGLSSTYYKYPDRPTISELYQSNEFYKDYFTNDRMSSDIEYFFEKWSQNYD